MGRRVYSHERTLILGAQGIVQPEGDGGLDAMGKPRYCQVEADGRFWCPVWRVRDGLEPSILGITRRAFRQLDNAVRTTGTLAFVVLNAVAPAGHDADHAAATLTDLAIEICPVRLGQRVALARALITGQAAQEFEPNGKAATEIEQLHDFITAHLHLCKATT